MQAVRYFLRVDLFLVGLCYFIRRHAGQGGGGKLSLRGKNLRNVDGDGLVIF